MFMLSVLTNSFSNYTVITHILRINHHKGVELIRVLVALGTVTKTKMLFFCFLDLRTLKAYLYGSGSAGEIDGWSQKINKRFIRIELVS